MSKSQSKSLVAQLRGGAKVINFTPDLYFENKVINRKSENMTCELRVVFAGTTTLMQKINLLEGFLDVLRLTWIIKHEIKISDRDRTYGTWLKLEFVAEKPEQTTQMDLSA